MKHTPGPWKLVEDAQGPMMVMHPTKHGKAIASLTDVFKPLNGFIYDPPYNERTANACLIAAAPDLLETLQRVLSFICCEDRHAQAKAAIAKATGGA